MKYYPLLCLFVLAACNNESSLSLPVLPTLSAYNCLCSNEVAANEKNAKASSCNQQQGKDSSGKSIFGNYKLIDIGKAGIQLVEPLKSVEKIKTTGNQTNKQLSVNMFTRFIQ